MEGRRAREPQTPNADDFDAESSREAAPPAPQPSGDLVSVRVLKKGDGEIFTGRHENGEATRHARNDIIEGLDRTIALELEERGFAEIV
jgi:hypothetical protein